MCVTSAEGGLDDFQFGVIMCKVGAYIQMQVFFSVIGSYYSGE